MDFTLLPDRPIRCPPPFSLLVDSSQQPPHLYKSGGSFSRRICRGFLIDGERGFMVLYVCSPELNSVATEVRTGAMKAVG